MVPLPHITTPNHTEHPHTVCQTTLKIILNFFITIQPIKPNKYQMSHYIVHTGEKKGEHKGCDCLEPESVGGSVGVEGVLV